jgi:hypothetical protein
MTEQQVPPLRYASVGMTILFEGWGVIGKIREGPRSALQIPPLRFASVGMTKGGLALSVKNGVVDDRTAGPSAALRFGRDDNSFGKVEQQVVGCIS